MNDETYKEIAQDLGIADMPEDHQKMIVEKFAESLMGRLMVLVSGDLTDEQRDAFANAGSTEEQIAVLENAYGQSFEDINEVAYTNLVQEFKDLTK